MTQEPKPIESYKLLDIVDLVAIAKNALMLLEDFQTDMNSSAPEASRFQELKQQMDDMLKDKYVKRFITLDDDFDTDTINTIMDNSVPFTAEQVKVFATATNDKGVIKLTGRLAEYVRKAETADIKLDELQNALIDSDFVKENFWAYRSIDNDIDEARDRLEPLLANTMRVKS